MDREPSPGLGLPGRTDPELIGSAFESRENRGCYFGANHRRIGWTSNKAREPGSRLGQNRGSVDPGRDLFAGVDAGFRRRFKVFFGRQLSCDRI